MMQFCFAMEIRGSARLILGNKDEANGIEEKGQVLTSRAASSLVIDNLCDQARGQNTTVACFYFDFAVQKEQSATNTMGALLKQVVSGLEEIPEEISRPYQDQKKAIGGRGPRLADIVKMLQITTSKERTFICIDALDECLQEYRVKVLNSLDQILRKSPGTRIFMTGRPHIRSEVGRRLAGKVASLSISPRRDDITIYLRSRLEEDATPDAMDSRLEAEILEKISENISETYVGATALGKPLQICTDEYAFRFLLVSLNIDAVLQETTIHRRRQKLSAMTSGLGLGDAYGATLGRIKGQGGERARLGIAALMWLSHSERPLKVDELCHALAVEIGLPNLNTDNVPSLGTLIACCQGLVVADKEASTVRLIHFTLQEHLRAHPDPFGAVHSTMAETCLTYLISQKVTAFSTNLSPDLQDTPFLEYSSLYWGVHARRGLSDCAKLLALKLFSDYNTHISTQILFKAERPYMYLADFDKNSLFSGLHCASFFGIVEIVASLVEVEGCDINQMDCGGNTPLAWAAWGGHERVVKILLARDGVNADKSDKCGQTALLCAAERGNERVVEILLSRDDISPDKSDVLGRTPLHWAAEKGFEGVVNILLGCDSVSPDKPDISGRTPLSHAAGSGHEGVVKILLGRDDVDPDEPDALGQTPLHLAAERGCEGVVKMLLDFIPNRPEYNGTTLLWRPAYSGNGGVVKMLLGRGGVNPDKRDRSGQTPLCLAAKNGHEGVVKILLGRDGVNPEKPDKYGRTPLFYAENDGHKGVIALLQPLESATHSPV